MLPIQWLIWRNNNYIFFTEALFIHLNLKMQLLPKSLLTFSDLVQREWIDGSAINPELFASTVEILADEVISNGDDISYPIHEALNWKASKWRTAWQSGRQQRPELFGALINTWNPFLEKPEVGVATGYV